MKRFLIASVLLLISINQVIGQTKIVPVTKSALTGIELPAGSKQDNRILATAAAKTLLQMKADETSLTLGEQDEVFILLPSTGKQMEEQVKSAAQKAGWEIQSLSTETTYSLLKNKERMVMMYLASQKKETSLYFSTVNYVQPVAEVKTVTPVVQATPQVLTEVQPQKQIQVITPVVPVVEAKQQQSVSTNAFSDGFSFTSTNFDDGWTATSTPDYVKVINGSMNIQLFYSVTLTDQMRNSNVELSDQFWNQLVVPNYTVKSAQRFEESVTYFRTYFIEGEATDPKTGKPCYLALNVLVSSGVATPVLAIAPDKNSYYQQFPEPKNLGNMTGYNKFAVSAKDIVGSWSVNSGSSVSLYNTYTGNYAGSNYTQGSDSFVFNADGTYSSKHSGVSSMYGVNTAFTEEYKGMTTVTNWDLSLTHRWKDATENFSAQFEVVRGGRILHLQNKSASGIQYHLVRVK